MRLSTTRADDIEQLTAGPFVQARVRWNSWLRTVAGLRADDYYADVKSNLAANSGSRQAAILSPKLAVTLGPWSGTELYLDYGYGFHSNDARGATIRVDPRTGSRSIRSPRWYGRRARTSGCAPRRSRTSDLRHRVPLGPRLRAVFSGDAGDTQAGRPSRREGLELQNFYRRAAG